MLWSGKYPRSLCWGRASRLVPKLVIWGLQKMSGGCSLELLIYRASAIVQSNEWVEVSVRNVSVEGESWCCSFTKWLMLSLWIKSGCTGPYLCFWGHGSVNFWSCTLCLLVPLILVAQLIAIVGVKFWYDPLIFSVVFIVKTEVFSNSRMKLWGRVFKVVCLRCTDLNTSCIDWINKIGPFVKVFMLVP